MAYIIISHPPRSLPYYEKIAKHGSLIHIRECNCFKLLGLPNRTIFINIGYGYKLLFSYFFPYLFQWGMNLLNKIVTLIKKNKKEEK